MSRNVFWGVDPKTHRESGLFAIGFTALILFKASSLRQDKMPLKD
jgi:hypothetical protein